MGNLTVEKVLALAAYAADVQHVHEATGQNDGPEVEKYLAVIGLHRGDQWCLAFELYLLQQAGVQGWPKTGWVPYIADWCEAHHCLHSSPQRGDWFIEYDEIGPMHIGIVTSTYGSGSNARIKTIEGNESNSVMRNDRPVSDGKYGRWVDVLAPGGSDPAPVPVPAPPKKGPKVFAKPSGGFTVVVPAGGLAAGNYHMEGLS